MNEQVLAQQKLTLGAARIFVYDLGAAHAFYTGKLGLRLVAGGDRLGYLVYDAGHTQVIVEAVAPDASEDEHALVGRFTGLSFYVAEIAAAHKVLLSLGVFFSSAPAAQAWGGILATFSDAADNQLNLVQLDGEPRIG